MTPIAIEPLTMPLRQDETGDIYVGDTRVFLDLVVWSWQNGETPEAIVQSYPALKLPDVYAVIAYYLAHQEQVEAYMRQREEEGDAIQRQLEAEGIATPWEDFRSKLQSCRESTPISGS